MPVKNFEFDVFVCHASEDKESVVRPLAKALEACNLSVWFDEMVLKIGDSLARKIDEGLSKSQYGIVVLSPSFFHKNWPRYELDGLLARETADATKVILPVWHEVDVNEVQAYSLPLSIRLAGRTANGIDSLAKQLAEVIMPSGMPNNVSISDELSLAKNVVLTLGLKHKNEVRVFESDQHGKFVVIGGYGYNDSEKQRKLFLAALEQLISAKLIEHVSGILYETTYQGIQVAERLELVEKPERLGMT